MQQLINHLTVDHTLTNHHNALSGECLTYISIEHQRVGKLTLEGELLERAQTIFDNHSAIMTDNLTIIQRCWDDHEYLLCPNSSI